MKFGFAVISQAVSEWLTIETGGRRTMDGRLTPKDGYTISTSSEPHGSVELININYRTIKLIIR